MPVLKDVEDLRGHLMDLDKFTRDRFERVAEAFEETRATFHAMALQDRDTNGKDHASIAARICRLEDVLGISGEEASKAAPSPCDAVAGDPGPPHADIAAVRQDLSELCRLLRDFKVVEIHTMSPADVAMANARATAATPAKPRKSPRAPRPAEIRTKEARASRTRRR